MRFDSFLSYIGYSKETPEEVDSKRWNAMLLWYKKRKKNKDWIPKELLLIDNDQVKRGN